MPVFELSDRTPIWDLQYAALIALSRLDQPASAILANSELTVTEADGLVQEKLKSM